MLGDLPYSYSLCDIVYDNRAVCVSIVHGSQRLVALLSRSVPDLELHGRLLIQGEGLCEESSADRGFSVVVELILAKGVSARVLCASLASYHTLTKRRTSELFPTADSPVPCQHHILHCDSWTFVLTQQYELELREPSAARAATLLHALGHVWAFWESGRRWGWRVVNLYRRREVLVC